MSQKQKHNPNTHRTRDRWRRDVSDRNGERAGRRLAVRSDRESVRRDADRKHRATREAGSLRCCCRARAIVRSDGCRKRDNCIALAGGVVGGDVGLRICFENDNRVIKNVFNFFVYIYKLKNNQKYTTTRTGHVIT